MGSPHAGIGGQRHRRVIDRRVQQEAGTIGSATRGIGEGYPRRDAQLAAVAGALHRRAAHGFGEHVLAEQEPHAFLFRVDQVDDDMLVAHAFRMQPETGAVDFALASEIGRQVGACHSPCESQPVHASRLVGNAQPAREGLESAGAESRLGLQHGGGRAHGVLVGVHVGGQGGGHCVGAGVEARAGACLGLPPGHHAEPQ